jgi:hypothetical protein
MNVNSIFKAVVRNQFVILCGVSLFIIVIFFTASSFTRPSSPDKLATRANLAVREIGHQLLLQAGDSTSRVLPVKETGDGNFLLEFENEFDFKPDTLISLAQRLLTKAGLEDYTVTVYECFKPVIVYGFEVNTKGGSIEPCRGRIQPQSCYNIQVAFSNLNDVPVDYASLSLIFTASLFFVSIVLAVGNFATKKSDAEVREEEATVASSVNTALPSLGKFTFDIRQQKLLLGDTTIVLTDKECKVLELLNRNFGALTTREDLIQQVWINEGVITGRSLDMFVSKLRKKLHTDSSLRITNIHGKGYRLEVI